MSNDNKETASAASLPPTGQKTGHLNGIFDAKASQRASTATCLYFVEWVVEHDQVILHQFGSSHQDEQIYHLTVTELLKKVAFPDRKYVEQLVTYLINGEIERCEAEFRILDASGETQWVYGKGRVQYHDQRHQQVAKIVGVISDVQAKDRISDAPGSTYPLFSEINDLPVGIIQVDLPTATIDMANGAASQILQLPDKTAVQSFPDTDTADWVSVSEVLYRRKEILNRVLKLPSLNQWILFSARRSTSDKAILVLQDITELKEENLSLQKVNSELDNFVYHASHDLRTPLRSILLSLDILRKIDNPLEREKCVELIEGSINRLDTFITDLLSISRNRQLENPLVSVNFMVEVEMAVAGSYHVGSTQNLEVVTKISQPNSFMADLTRIRVILNNLISNAIKYRRYDTKRSHITVEVWVDEEEAHLKISDNGEGIADTELSRIFDMFYRASERSEGSGLGLYIVKDVVEKLGGTISVRSKLNKGTTFSVTLPNNRIP